MSQHCMEKYIGQKFGALTVAAVGKSDRLLLCRCECGNSRLLSSQQLRTRQAKSCNCNRHKNKAITRRTYRSWEAMMTRCFASNHVAYHLYGGRGITVCERWRDVNKFWEDMGTRPDHCTLDRFPNKDGNYEPGNCRWATWQEQARNRSNNHTLTVNRRQRHRHAKAIYRKHVWEWNREEIRAYLKGRRRKCPPIVRRTSRYHNRRNRCRHRLSQLIRKFKLLS